jgi:ABC-type oligopeptide transport system substrate-binding subunit
MTKQVDAEAMFEEFDRKMRASAFNRRSFLKSAAFGMAMMAGASGVAEAAAQSGTPEIKGTPDAKQIFYNSFLQEDPKSFDWNADLYCNAEQETFEGLLKFDVNGTPVAGWAEKWEANADASVWTFHIRKDNKGWTNGDPVTADDFVWSFTRLLDPKTANSYSFILYDVKGGEEFNTKNGSPDALGLKALDQWTFEMTLVGPRANLPQKVA